MKAKAEQSTERSAEEAAADGSPDASTDEAQDAGSPAEVKAQAEMPAAAPGADASAGEGPSAGVESTADVTSGDAAAEQPAADEAASEEVAEGSAANEPVAKKSVRTRPQRPTVGVVYEPDESPDGFPLEYGNIIVGLPKSSGGGKPAEEADDATPEQVDAAEATNPAEGTPDNGADDAAPEPAEAEADGSTEVEPTNKAAEAPKKPAEGASEASHESATADSAESDGETAHEEGGALEAGPERTETQSDDGQPAPTHADAASDEAPEQPEASDQSEVADQAEAADGAEGTGEQADATFEGSDAAADQSDGTATSKGRKSKGGKSDGDQSDGAPASEGAEPDGDRSVGAEAEASDEQLDASADQPDQSDEEPGSDGDKSGGAEGEGSSAERGAADQSDQSDDGSASEGADGDRSADVEAEGSAVQADAAGQADGATTSDGGESEGAASDGELSAEAEGEGTVEESGAAEQSDQPDQGSASTGAGADGDESVDAEGDGRDKQRAEAGAEAQEADAAAGEAQSDADADLSADETQSAAEADAASGEAKPTADADTEADEAAEGDAAAGETKPTADADAEADEAAEGDAAAGDGQAVEEPEELTAEQMAERMAAEQAAMALITALMRLRGAVATSQLPIDVVGADEARQQQKAMLDQLDDYILPRLVQLEAPVLAVVGGSTGAGKSTLVNTIIGKVVSEPGVLRPTTRSPVLIHHPADAEWFVGDRVLPGMARSSGDSPGGTEDAGQLRLVAADTVPQGLAILDAPDIDSVVEANRDLATQLLAAADLWLFVTTAARYADAVPWDFLQSASDRSTAVAVVLDRAPEDTIDDITGHLAQMLLERGLGDSPLFSIRETVVDGNGMLPQETVASIKDWLIDLAADAEARAAVVRRTLHGAVSAMVKQTPPFAIAVKAQAEAMIELRSSAETAYDRAVKDIAKATQDGTLLRGEVLARWQEFVGTGELLKGLQTNVGRMRDKMKDTVVGKPPPTRDLKDAVESGLESLLREHAEAAAERAEESWQSTAPGRQLLAAGDRDLGRMSKDFPAAAGRAVRDWQGYVLDLVRKEGADKRSTARILAYGVNGLGLSLMVVIFASTAGITGAEVGVGAGTAVVGQKLLEAVFGDQAVRTLVTKAREDLDGRVHALMDAEFARYLAVLDQHPVDSEAARQLTEAARAVEDCT